MKMSHPLVKSENTQLLIPGLGKGILKRAQWPAYTETSD